MPTSSTAAVRGFNPSTGTSPPLTPTRPADRPAIAVPSEPGYSARRFIDSPVAYEQHLRPPPLASVPPAEDPEAAGRARMAAILAEIGFPVTK
ncbi:hypothetical protein CPLU01_04802 [Colletotrichum plurivorum]|uniref:Uncharacterized protein n=1 Tax=Colletotrichum plurivorum TaxID=2175906 RepID=A0A8H6NJ37_9PEZI|nr:hypothetical protein CPLU01_04802 [Colletotrichum plurivorum]